MWVEISHNTSIGWSSIHFIISLSNDQPPPGVIILSSSEGGSVSSIYLMDRYETSTKVVIVSALCISETQTPKAAGKSTTNKDAKHARHFIEFYFWHAHYKSRNSVALCC